MAGTLQGKTALITGAAKRIGRTTALALAREGVNILVHYSHSAEEAVSLCGELAALGVKAWSIRADFADPAEYETLIARSLQAAGRLDILINNAAVFPRSTLTDVTFEEICSLAQVNAWVPLVLSRQFAQQAGQGAVINLLDTRIASYDFSHVAYMLSKQMLALLTKMTALEFAPKIRVNAVAPGLILPPPDKAESYLESLVYSVPLKRHGESQDIADAIVFLLKSDFITGDILYVDGGRHLTETHDGPHVN